LREGLAEKLEQRFRDEFEQMNEKVEAALEAELVAASHGRPGPRVRGDISNLVGIRRLSW
jgi:hypothetical protein